jgi:hypothetical protein
MKPLPPVSQRKLLELATRCATLHSDLFAAGLWKTGRKMNEVVRVVDYEIAEFWEKKLSGVAEVVV